MLAYRHLFHAGNFADVFKHALLARLLAAIAQKEKPFFYLDTHAGIGRYDLTHAWAQKAREYQNGIARVWKADDAPRALEAYLGIVRGMNRERLRWYPGSPLIARHFVRQQDRMVLVELNKADYAELKRVLAGSRSVAVEMMDAYAALKAYLPPPERRGLVLIDSSFDRARELDRLVKGLKQSHARWPTGTYAAWYPIMAPAPMRDFETHVRHSGMRKVLRLEIEVRERDDSGIIPGCGMLVVNPPWHFDVESRTLVEWIAKKLVVSGAARWRVEWLVPE